MKVYVRWWMNKIIILEGNNAKYLMTRHRSIEKEKLLTKQVHSNKQRAHRLT